MILDPDERIDMIESWITSATQISEHKDHHYIGAAIAASLLPKTSRNPLRMVTILLKLADAYDEKSELNKRTEIETLIINYIDRPPESAKGPKIIEIFESVASRMQSSISSVGLG